MDIADITAAVKELSPSAFKLYLYLGQNQDNYRFGYSPKDFMMNYGVSESSAKRAKAELVEKGYIVVKGNTFEFNTVKVDTKKTLDILKDKINLLSKNLRTCGIEKETLLKIINYYKKDNMSDKDLEQAYKNILQEFEKIIQKMDDIL